MEQSPILGNALPNRGLASGNRVDRTALSETDMNWQRPISPEFPPLAQMFIESLACQVAENNGVNSGLLVAHQGLLRPELYELLGGVSFTQISPSEFDPETCEKTPLLLSLVPWGLHGQNPRRHLEEIAETTRCLNPEGWAIVMIPGFHRAFRDHDLEQMLRRRGVYLHAIINAPNRLLGNGLRPVFVVASPKSSDRVFLLDCQSSHTVNLSSLFEATNADDIRSGIWLRLSEFTSFEHWRVQKEIESLEGDFGKFNKFVLSDVALVQSTPSGEKFDDIPGCTYLPTIGNGPALANLSLTTMQHHNYFQLVVNQELATPDYLCAYFNSKHFRLYLEAEKSSRSLVIPKLTKRQALTLPISLPSLDIQKKVTNNLSKLHRLREMVDELTHLIAVNPLADAQAQQIDEALSVFGKLTQEEQVISLIRDGESKILEFKETFSLNRHREGKDKELETAVVKTICAFLNSEGGDLLVGVTDNGDVVGLGEEIRRFHRDREDTFLLHLKNVLYERIGAEHYPSFDTRLVPVKGQKILRISCKPSTSEVFVDGREFYVRTNPATDKLEGRKLIDYIQARFPTSSRPGPS